MKTVVKIAKLELSNLFYSPIAWMILIIFIFQTGGDFGELLVARAKSQFSGYQLNAVTANLFYNNGGIFLGIQHYLYLYIPLLTMGLLSSDFNRGTIKLLFSAPITSTQIVLGKYLAVMTYGLSFIVILFVYVLIGGCLVVNFDWPAVLCGLLGLYLLLGAYAAIGLFMSSLTQYQIVAAISTFVVFGILNYMGFIGQDTAFLREITYWFSLSGRVIPFIQGMIGSEDVIYFLMIIFMFLALCVYRIRFKRTSNAAAFRWCRYLGVILFTSLVGYVTSRPVLKFYYDGTHTKKNTLTKASQEIVDKLDGGLKITSYSNMLDDMYAMTHRQIMYDMKRYDNYLRFKPETKLKYVFYFDEVENKWLNERYPNTTVYQKADSLAYLRELKLRRYLTPEEIRAKVDLSREEGHFVAMVERDNGDKVPLRVYNDAQRYPSEAEISAAMKRLAMKLPNVAFLAGHGEPSITGDKNRDFTSFANDRYFRYALINQGFDTDTRVLEQGENQLDGMNVLVIADPQRPFADWELEQLYSYIDAGNNLVIAGNPKHAEYLKPLLDYLGVCFAPGTLVNPKEEYPADLIFSGVTETGLNCSRYFRSLIGGRCVTMPGAMTIGKIADKGFEIFPMLVSSDTNCWTEVETIDFVNDTLIFNSAQGEVRGQLATAVGMTKQVGGKEQRIVVIGDTDCFTMGELSARRRNVHAYNFNFIMGTFNWLSYGEAPVDVSRPREIDDKINLEWETATTIRSILKWGVSGLIFVGGVILLIRRKRK